MVEASFVMQPLNMPSEAMFQAVSTELLASLHCLTVNGCGSCAFPVIEGPTSFFRLKVSKYFMSHDQLSGNTKLPAPCIVDVGIVVNKHDMHRLLADLGRVRYTYSQDGHVLSDGEGYILEVFSDPQRSTLVANHALYLNVCSFDYLELGQSSEQEAAFHLIQDARQLVLVPLSNPLQEQSHRSLNAAALEAVVAEVLSAGWDVRIDDEDGFSL